MTRSNCGGKKRFFSGFLWLSLSTAFVKVLGLIYKIPMLSILGSEGMGYFNSSYEIYTLFCVIATAGLPVALSVLISAALERNDPGTVRRVDLVSMRTLILIGLAGTAAMAGFSSVFCRLIRSENARLCMIAVSPTVFFICVSASIRGYFQGHQRMFPTAFSQFLEAAGKLLFGLLFARHALDAGCDAPTVAAAAGVGLTTGTFCSTAYLIFEKIRDRAISKKRDRSSTDTTVPRRDGILKTLLRMAIPVTLGASAVSMTKLLDMAMILRRLQSIGFDAAAANEAYGNYTTLALSVYGLVPSLLSSIALPLVPMLSAAVASGSRERQAELIRLSYRMTAFFAIPASLGITLYAGPILRLLFPNVPDATTSVTPLLSVLGASVFLSCMITATHSVLHAYQKMKKPIVSLAVGAVVKATVAYLLIGNPGVGILGAPVSTLLCNATVVFLNLYFAQKLCRIEGLWRTFFKPLFCASASVGIIFGMYRIGILFAGESRTLLLAAILTTCVSYAILTILTGTVTPEDLKILPGGEKTAGLLSKIKIFRRLKRKEYYEGRKSTKTHIGTAEPGTFYLRGSDRNY